MNLARSVTALALFTVLAIAPAMAADKDDPLGSARWEDMRKGPLGGRPAVFDARVQVIAPATAENPMQVPVRVDASALPGVEEVLVFADFNPIVEVLRFYPEAAPARLGFRVKLQQSTPVRAAARTADGVWHVGGTWVETVGGGCTAPSATAANTAWQTQLNAVSGRLWSEGPNAGRLRLRIVHPMDTGLIPGTPAFHLEDLEFRAADGRRLMRVRTFEPVSENPVFTLEHGDGTTHIEVSGRDNNGNRFSARVAP